MDQEASFGKFIKEQRLLLGLTQAELARRVGCATITIRKIEGEALRPSVQIAERLAMALDISLEERAGFVRWARRALEDTPEPEPTPTPPPSAEEIGREDLTGRAVRGYQLADRIGEGGFGAIYRATQPTVEREVAVKIILPRYANDPDFIRRFEAEAQLVARLEHPFIVPLYDFWREPDAAYLVMRLMRGGSLNDLLQNGALPLERALPILDQVSQALYAAHRFGVVHRDLKPANILLDDDGNAYLADFGIAKNLGDPEMAHHTQTGSLIGSFAYLSPEQIRSESVRPQADIYALGVLLFQLLAGELPFAGPTPVDYIQQHLTLPMPSLLDRNPGLPPAMEDVVRRATAKNAAERYADVMAMLAEIRTAVSAPGFAVEWAAQDLNPVDPDAIENPFKGLRPFGEADADDFFGRETLVQDLLSALGTEGDLSRFLAVVGPSGSGKSSAVKAGLLPALRRGGLPGSENWFIADFLPGTHPFEELEAALLRVAVNPPGSLLEQLLSGERGLSRAVRRVLPEDERVELVLVIDQFEELFTLVEDVEVRDTFLQALVAAVIDPRSRLRVVLTLRADFVDRPLEYVDFGELMRERMAFVVPMTPDELEEAVLRPAQRVGLVPEPGLAARIGRELGDQPGMLPLLQHTLSELYERRNGRRLTLDSYQEIGGVLGSLGRSADLVYEKLDSAGQAAARQLFLRLVTLGEGVEDTRRRVLQGEVLSLAGKEGEAAFLDVMDRFGKARLLTFDRDPATRRPTVEVAHEALLREWERLREWLNESRSDIRLQRQLARAAAEWRQADQDGSFLLRGARLEQFEGWSEAAGLALTEEERAFLAASIAQRDAEEAAEADRQAREAKLEKRAQIVLRVLVGVFALAAIISGGLALFANQQRQEALRQASVGLAAQAIAALDSNAPERGVLLALEALDEYPYTPQAESALAQSVYRYHSYISLAGNHRVLATEFSMDGRLLAGSDALSLVIWDAATGEVLVDISRFDFVNEDIYGLAIVSDNRKLLTASRKEGYASVWDLASGEEALRYEGHAGLSVYTIYASADDRLALTSGADGTARIWSVETGETLQVFELPSGEVRDAVWSPDERLVATASSDGSIRVWDVQTGEELRSWEAHFGNLTSLSWSSNGRIASAGADGVGRIWNADTGDLLFALIGHDAGVTDIAWAPDSTRLATAGLDGLTRVWDGLGGAELFALAGADTATGTVSWSPDGRRLAAGGGALPRIWDVTSPVVRLVGHVNANSTNYAYWSADGSFVGTGGYWENAYRLWDPMTGENIKTFDDIIGGGLILNSAGTEAVAGPPDRIIDLETESERHFPVQLEAETVGAQWSRDGSLVTLQDLIGGKYHIFNADTLELLYAGSHREECRFDFAGAFSPNKAYLELHCWGGPPSILITEALTGRVVRELEGHTGDGTFWVSWSPDGTKLASAGSSDQTVRIWDMKSGETVTIFSGHSAPVYFVEWAPNGRRLASGDTGGFTLIWDSETGGEVNRYNVGGSIFYQTWSPDGTHILTTGFFDAPEIRPAWQTTEDLIAYAGECCVLRDLTPEEREQFGLPPAEGQEATGDETSSSLHAPYPAAAAAFGLAAVGLVAAGRRSGKNERKSR